MRIPVRAADHLKKIFFYVMLWAAPLLNVKQQKRIKSKNKREQNEDKNVFDI